MTSAHAQNISASVGPASVNIDTGNDWLDLGFFIVVLALITAALLKLKRRR